MKEDFLVEVADCDPIPSEGDSGRRDNCLWNIFLKISVDVDRVRRHQCVQ